MVKKYLTALKNIIFPALCFSCERKINQGFICSSCEEQIELIYPPLCKLCGSSIYDNKTFLCKNCLGKKYSYDRMISAAYYKDPLISLIHSFKYTNHDYLDNFLATIMIKHFTKIGLDISNHDLITAVPMHKLKLKERGYNQSELLAKLLAKHFKISFRNDIIIEQKYKPSQTTLDKRQRKLNIENAFIVNTQLKNEKIAIVDDIFTTGATAQSISQALKDKGAGFITILTLAKTQ